ncbi:hypothetical protein O1M63_10475 [Streptomyces mirabilis]|nr:hypothetical protein [Streptomyces mirabilis]
MPGGVGSSAWFQQVGELAEGHGHREPLRAVRVHDPAHQCQCPGRGRARRGEPCLGEHVGELVGRAVGRHGEREEHQHGTEATQMCRVAEELRQARRDRHRGDHHGGAEASRLRIGQCRERRTEADAHRHGHRGHGEDTRTTAVGQVAPERGGERAQHGKDGECGSSGEHQRHRGQCHGQRRAQSEEERSVHRVQGERAARREDACQCGAVMAGHTTETVRDTMPIARSTRGIATSAHFFEISERGFLISERGFLRRG